MSYKPLLLHTVLMPDKLFQSINRKTRKDQEIAFLLSLIKENICRCNRGIILLHHYDPKGYFPRVWEKFLSDIVSGLDVFAIISSSFLDPAAQDALQGKGIGVFLHDGHGKCIGSYQKISEAIKLSLNLGTLESHPWLFLLNDSVLPVITGNSACVLLSRLMEDYRCDEALVGISDSFQEGSYHLQSYFLAASPRLIASPPWSMFWNEYTSTNNRSELISKGELGLSASLGEKNCKLVALYGFKRMLSISPDHFNNRSVSFADSAMSKRYDEINLSINYWKSLLLLGAPFVKKSVLLDKFGLFHKMELPELFEIVPALKGDEMFLDDIICLMKTRLEYPTPELSLTFTIIKKMKKMLGIPYLLYAAIVKYVVD